jgi:hypothetical protein
MYHWRWSNGETYYKSAREIPDSESTDDFSQPLVYDSRQNAINQSLADNINNSSEVDMIDITNSMFSRSQNETNNRRENLDNKLANREMLFQRGVNPFLNQTSYVNDVVVRDMFLKPACTTHEKIKEENSIESNN